MEHIKDLNPLQSRTWTVDELGEVLFDAISPLQTYGGICQQYIKYHEKALEGDIVLDADIEEMKRFHESEKAFFMAHLGQVENSLMAIRDVVEWMKGLPKED